MKIRKLLKSILVTVLVFGLALLACSIVFRRFDTVREEGQRSEVEYIAENIANKLEISLTEYEQIAHLWSGVISAGVDPETDFEEISRQLYEKNPTINAIQLAPDGVIEYTYPRNIDIIGYNIFEEDANSADAQLAKETGVAVVSGPVELVQGGTGLILRYPIYIDEEFWGFSVVVLNVPEVFDDVNFDRLSDEGYTYCLYKDGAFVLGDRESVEDSVDYSVEIASKTWTLSVAPADGWIMDSFDRDHVIVSVVISLLFAGGAFLVMKVLQRNKELEDMRSDLTIQVRALAASEKANKLQSKALEASKKANEMQAEALEASKMANRAQFDALESAKKENMRQAAQLEASEAANRAKTEFISRISHDIRTPIGAIKNLTEFAMRDMDDREKLKGDLEKIETSNKFLLSLINDVLDISRVDSGKIELNPEPYPRDEYITNIRNILEPMCNDKGLNFEIVQELENKGIIYADKVRLNQIVLNIISNAVKYTPHGGNVKYISQCEDLPDNTVLYRFTVEDTGIGMSEEFQKRMFDEFAQEYDNPGRAQGSTGTGLGLAIVKKMVNLMDGDITVKSAVGEGTSITVKIIFPDAARDPRYMPLLEKKNSGKEETRKFDGTVLIAEDNEINREIAIRIFEELGLTVDIAENGQIALDKFVASEENHYDAIFMDIQMPVLNGYETTLAIRRLDRSDAMDIPIIAMTADAFDEAMRKAERVGMNEYITKPLNEEYIVQILLKYL